MTFADDVFSMFISESQKLQNLTDMANNKTDMNVHEIVEIYYQVMNVSSMIVMLKQQISLEPKELMEKIQESENLISEKFNSIIHPKILQKLSTTIKELTKNLQSRNSNEKSKEQIESDAKLFEELRQNMSTKDFVEQYDYGIAND